MHKQLLILGCSQTKRQVSGLLPAIDRYDGSHYRVLRNYLHNKQWPDNLSIAILSAKYGLIGGFANIENYDERMSSAKASEWAPHCQDILEKWSRNHSRIYFSLGKDYMPAVMPTIEKKLRDKSEVFNGPIGLKLHQTKEFLEKTEALNKKHFSNYPEPGTGRISYFLPDWDDLLDENFDFELDKFSGFSRQNRNDKHCSILIKKKMSDGILVSLAQHISSKGPLKKIIGTDPLSLSPINLHSQYRLKENQYLFGDCGAFSYVNDEIPAISSEQAFAIYDLYGFNFGASVDHIPVPIVHRDGQKVSLNELERKKRVSITKKNAEKFIELAKKRKEPFIPVGTVQALSPKEYAKTVSYYHSIGYRYMAIGGLVPLPDGVIEEIVKNVMNVVKKLKPRPWIHLFGIFRPKLQNVFREYKIDSFDSASYFRKAWLRSDQNYLSTNGKWYAAIRVPMTSDGRTRKYIESKGLSVDNLEALESKALTLLNKFDKDEVGTGEVLDTIIEYDKHFERSSETTSSLRSKYRKTLEDRPWRKCDCQFCKNVGIHVLIFRGANRNKRRGAHNTLMLYRSLKKI